MKYIEELYKYLPQNDKINWDLINNGILKPFYKHKLKEYHTYTLQHSYDDAHVYAIMVYSS